MAEIIVSIPVEIEEEIKELSRLRFSLVITNLIKSELERLARLKRIVSESKFTIEDVQELSNESDKALSQRFLQSLNK